MFTHSVQCLKVLRPLVRSSMSQNPPFLNRYPSFNFAKTKWLWGKDAEGPEVGVGIKCGAHDDPILNTSDTPYLGEKDDPPLQMWYYRQLPPQTTTRLEKRMLTLISALIWGWFVYHLYYNYGEIFGEYYIPAPEEFTDEELGIPPDDAPDPEYWGDHPLSRGM